MEEFCGSRFCDIDLSWNTENSTTVPDLTLCFQNTVLVWIPCAFLWVSSSFYFALYFCSNSDFIPETEKIHDNKNRWKNGKTGSSSDNQAPLVNPTVKLESRDSGVIPWNAFNVLKIIICLVLILTQLVRLGGTLNLKFTNFIVYPVEIYTPILRISTYAIALAFIVILKKIGARSSIIQFAFWFQVAFFQSIKFRTTLLMIYDNRNGFGMDHLTLTIILDLIDFPLVVGQFLLHCWTDCKIGVKNKRSEEKLECPEYTASPLSRLLFSWFDSLTWKGSRNALQAKDLWRLNPEDSSSVITEKFTKSWNRKLFSKSQRNPEVRAYVGSLSVLFSAFGGTFLVGCVLKIIPDLLAFASPQVLKLLIAFISSDEDNWKGYFYAVLLFTIAFVSTLILACYNHVMFMLGLRIKSALTSALYRKSLVISNSAKKETTTGEIVNLMSVDVNNIIMVVPFINFLWSSPFQIGLSLYFIWELLGPSTMAGLGVILVLIPANFVLGSFLRSYLRQQMKFKDERIKLISEILSGIKILKLYAWEPSFQDEVMKIREKEMRILRKTAYLTGLYDFCWTCSQFLVALVTFATYVLVDETHVLDAEKVFVSLSLMNAMALPLTALPRVVVYTNQALVSFGRLNKFLNAEVIDTSSISHNTNEQNPIVIENGFFSWEVIESNEKKASEQMNLIEHHDRNVLKNINLRVKKGSLVAIIGPVGSGKSTLLSAILGEVEKTSGRVNTIGTTSYVAQQAWIQNGTLRDNILFGKQYEPLRYNAVIDACSLGPDLDIFSARDQIEIGEKGINLSGGQKQRVSIARAVYKNSDLYLLDDPLSAVDSHVGKHIFEKVLSSKGLLGRKTRVLVTNSLHFLYQVDIIVMMKNGEISQMGTYDELMSQNGEFAELINLHTNELDEEEEEETDQELRKQSISSETKKVGRLESKEDGNREELEKLVLPETMETEGVKWSIYMDYFRAAGWGRVFLTSLLFIVFQAFAIGSNFWLTVWAAEPIVNGTQGNRDMFLAVYTGLGLAQSVAFVAGIVVIGLAVLHSASVFHLKMLAQILRSPMSFFDTTPTGRIVNRFSKDVDVMDNTLSLSIRMWLRTITMVLGTLCVIVYSTPIFFVVLIPISILYYLIQKFYIPTSRQLKRLESTTRSPIFSHFSETINGASTIRAYGEQQRFIEESDDKLDKNQECYYPTIVAMRWMAVRLETAGSLIIFFAAVFTVISRKTLSPSLVGLAVSYALQITNALNMLVRSICDLEANIVAVERVQEYHELPQEAPWKSLFRKPAKEWPANGSVQFKNYQTRYREGLDLVLKNITCEIKPEEKIGVVGRTGAGKSSLTLALFRIIEGVNDGSIIVDGEDIRKLGLHDVRSRLTIIPQDPVLFSGSLRFNLDPFGKYADSAVWRALELSNLKTFVEGLQGELQFQVSEGGGNLSVGQKQLVCLARALLRKSKILVLDEATAAVDLETDDLIQKTIRSEFKDSTVITIAHRLNTVMDSTRVMVIDSGKIAEFDSPAKLLENPKSQFYAMVNDAGLISKEY